MNVCQHCRQGRVSRPRNLCWHCYYAPGVRDLYPATSRYGRRGNGIGGGSTGLAPYPTNALPGSPEKILVLRQRAELRQDLFHPDDATYHGPAQLAQVG